MCSGPPQLCQAFPHTLYLGLEVLQVTLERLRLFAPASEPALEAERMCSAVAAFPVGVDVSAAAAVLRVGRIPTAMR